MNRKPHKITVLKGGPSAEYEVSLRTGSAVAEALRRLGYEVFELIVRDDSFVVPLGTDLVFICLHGAFGEDGQVQQILTARGLPFTGSGILASQMALDKSTAKLRFREAGVPTPTAQIWEAGEEVILPPPLVIKPSCEGSSVGLQFVDTTAELPGALQEALQHGSILVIEKFIKGRELTVGILGDQALPIVEIRPKGGRYDYVTKYTSGASEYFCPAELSEPLTLRIQQVALEAHRALGCSVYSRVDVMLDEDHEPWVLEINTIPGMTATSLLPKAAAAAGLSFDSLCERIVELSLNTERGIL